MKKIRAAMGLDHGGADSDPLPPKPTERDLWAEAAEAKPDPYAVLNNAETIAKSLRQRVVRGDHLAHIELLRLLSEDGNGKGLSDLINHAVFACRAVIELWESHDCFDDDDGRKKKERRIHNLKELAKVRGDFPSLYSWKKHDRKRWESMLAALPLGGNSIWKTATMIQSKINMTIVTLLFPVLEARRQQVKAEAHEERQVNDQRLREFRLHKLKPTKLARYSPPFKNVVWLKFDRKLEKLPSLSFQTRGKWARLMAELIANIDEQGGRIAIPAGHVLSSEIFRVGIFLRPEQISPELRRKMPHLESLSGLLLGPNPTFKELTAGLDREFEKSKEKRKKRLRGVEKRIRAAHPADREKLELRKTYREQKINQMTPTRGARISSWQQILAQRLESILKK